MDGLALLCTLHADGPATLKRLRSAGCANLTVLLERPINEVALALDVAPAAARRLLREARLLAERVGNDLEAEEGPAPVAAAAGPAPLVLELPPVTSASKLDQGDRALLERIVREGRAARPAADVTPAVAAPGLAPAPTALERLGLDLSGDCPWPTFVPAAAHDGTALPGTPPISSAPIDKGPDLAPLLALEGVDVVLARDLVRLGILTPRDLARADALLLGRELHVTFAQAKRLCFLARRAAGSVTPPAATVATPSLEGAKVASPAPVDAAPLPAVPPAQQPAAARPAWRIEPRTQPLMTAQEQHAAALDLAYGPLPVRQAPAPVQRPAAELPVEVARARFWEPRTGADTPSEPREPQGVPIDPSEIDRPRRFSDVRRTAARPAVGLTEAHPPGPSPGAPAPAAPASGPALPHHAAVPVRPVAAAPAAPRHQAPAESTCPGGTILGWNFEVPRPELPPAPEPAPSRRTWRPLDPEDHRAAGGQPPYASRGGEPGAGESSAGPFA